MDMVRSEQSLSGDPAGADIQREKGFASLLVDSFDATHRATIKWLA